MKNKTLLLVLVSLGLASCGGASISGTISTLESQSSSHPFGGISSDSSNESSSESEESTSSTSSASSEESSSNEFSSSQQSSSSSSSNSSVEDVTLVPLANDSVWNIGGALNSLRGVAFRNALASSIKGTGSKTTSYKSLMTVLEKSDAVDGGKIRPFYHEPGYGVSSGSCNKEHTWPNSRGAGETGPGADPQIIRPTLSSENNSRSNKYFGTPSSSSVFDPAEFGYEGARGEAARICFYAATRYYDTHGTGGSSKGDAPLSLDNNPAASPSNNTMGTLSLLLEWNRKYPVNAAETKRNSVLSSLGFAKNPFIDHPEYADYIWSSNGLRGADGGTQEESATEHKMVKAVSEISSTKEYFIVATESGSAYAMTSTAFSASLPWYISGVMVTNPTSDSIRTDVTSYAKWKFSPSGTSYTISTGSKKLKSYLSGTHYSLGLDVPSEATSVSENWTVSFAADGKLTLVGVGNGVYMEYYKNAFCGYSKSGSNPLYLFEQ